MSDYLETECSAVLQAALFRPGLPVEVSVPIRRKGLIGYQDRTASRIRDIVVLEGDIRINRPGSSFDSDPQAKGIGSTGDIWPNGIVAYEIDGADEDLVRSAIDHWERQTPLRFKETTSCNDRLSFINAGACWSYVGRNGGLQYLSLAFNCSLGSAVHEIGHAIGLWHEQSRADRDCYVNVIEENIIEGQLHNFEKHILDATDLGDYDYNSIMHYPPLAFSKNGEPTIIAKNGHEIGQRDGLSQGDLEAVKLLYRSLSWSAGNSA